MTITHSNSSCNIAISWPWSFSSLIMITQVVNSENNSMNTFKLRKDRSANRNPFSEIEAAKSVQRYTFSIFDELRKDRKSPRKNKCGGNDGLHGDWRSGIKRKRLMPKSNNTANTLPYFFLYSEESYCWNGQEDFPKALFYHTPKSLPVFNQTMCFSFMEAHKTCQPDGIPCRSWTEPLPLERRPSWPLEEGNVTAGIRQSAFQQAAEIDIALSREESIILLYKFFF